MSIENPSIIRSKRFVSCHPHPTHLADLSDKRPNRFVVPFHGNKPTPKALAQPLPPLQAGEKQPLPENHSHTCSRTSGNASTVIPPKTLRCPTNQSGTPEQIPGKKVWMLFGFHKQKHSFAITQIFMASPSTHTLIINHVYHSLLRNVKARKGCPSQATPETTDEARYRYGT